MKIKKLAVILLVVSLMSLSVYGGSYYTKENLTNFNTANIYLNGKLIAVKGQDTTMDNGEVLPTSLLFKDRIYVPLRFLSNNMGLTVDWDGSVILTSPSTDNSSGTTSSINLDYTSEFVFKGVGTNIKTVYIEDSKGSVITPKFKVDGSSVVISNTFNYSFKTNYSLNVVSGNAINKINFTVNDIKKESFTDKGYYFDMVVPANASKGYNFPFIIRVPKRGTIEESIKQMGNTLLVEGSNEFLTTTNDEAVEKVLNTYSGWYSSQLGDKGNYISVMSVFPRPWQDTLLYTHALDRDTLFGTYEYLNSLGRGNLYRIDNQYDAMIDAAQDILKNIGKTVDEQVFLIGFSASSDFATRFNYTHPDRAKAIVVNSAPTLPLTEYKGELLKFPAGVGDIQEVTGEPFNVAKYKDTPQFWHTGDKDQNDGTYNVDGWGNYGDRRNNDNQEGLDYRKFFGAEIVARKALLEKILNDAGFNNITHKTYAGVDHSWNDTIIKDALAFLKANE